jgi:hypothetical protein
MAWESTLGASGCQAVEADDGTVVASYVSEANARLIAAAPDLLAAAAIALTDLYLKADKDEIPEEWTSVKVLLAAIAKATGEVV